MLLALLLTLAAVNPREVALEDACDVVELNHFYDDQGRHVFDQVIFYVWDDGRRRHQVLDWRLVKSPAILPQRIWRAAGERWQCLWVDESGGGATAAGNGQLLQGDVDAVGSRAGRAGVSAEGEAEAAATPLTNFVSRIPREGGARAR